MVAPLLQQLPALSLHAGADSADGGAAGNVAALDGFEEFLEKKLLEEEGQEHEEGGMECLLSLVRARYIHMRIPAVNPLSNPPLLIP